MAWLQKQHQKNLLLSLILLLLIIPSIIPLLHKGFFITDDGEWMIIRFSAFYSALRDGQFPVRFLHSLNSGYGYPVATFLYPGFMYLGIPIQIITSNFTDTIKIISSLSLIGSAIFTYLWLQKIFSKTASLTGSLVATYLPYHLFDLYVRGSIGEIFALMCVPFILWMIERNSTFFTTIGISLLILSHNTLALIFLPIIIIYLLIKTLNLSGSLKTTAIESSGIIIAGIAMASFFTIPAIMELPYTIFSRTLISNPLSYFAGVETIGSVSLFISVAALIILLYKQNKIKNYKYVWLFLTVSLLSIFLSSQPSSFIWKNIPSSWIQFPFRLLSLLIISAPFLTAFVLSKLNRKMQLSLILIIIILLASSTIQLYNALKFTDRPDSYYFTNQSTTTVHGEYTPVWASQKPTQMPENKVEIIKGKGIIKNTYYNNKKISFQADIKEESKIQINTIYWPGWNLKINDKPAVLIFHNDLGVMQFNLPQGTYDVSAYFNETPLRITADAISIFGFIFLLILSRTKKIKNV